MNQCHHPKLMQNIMCLRLALITLIVYQLYKLSLSIAFLIMIVISIARMNNTTAITLPYPRLKFWNAFTNKCMGNTSVEWLGAGCHDIDQIKGTERTNRLQDDHHLCNIPGHGNNHGVSFSSLLPRPASHFLLPRTGYS